MPIWLLHDEEVAHVFDRSSAEMRPDAHPPRSHQLSDLCHVWNSIYARSSNHRRRQVRSGGTDRTRRTRMNQRAQGLLAKMHASDSRPDHALDELRREMDRGRPGDNGEHQTARGTCCRIANCRFTAVPVQKAEPGLGIRRRPLEPLVSRRDDGLERIGAVLIEVRICTEQPRHHRNRLRDCSSARR